MAPLLSPRARRPGFSTAQRERLRAVLPMAEELTGDHFRIARFDRDRYPYEVATLDGLDDWEISAQALAQVCRYDLPNRSRPGRGLRRSLYRICVQDHNVLDALRRDGEEISLDALLLYILTHELCHVIRFCDYRQLFEADEDTRGSEEAIVHSLTQTILARVKDSDIQKVLNLYADHRTTSNHVR